MPDLRRTALIVGAGAGIAGDGLFLTALAWSVLAATGSPQRLSLVLIVLAVVPLVTAPLAGQLVDRPRAPDYLLARLSGPGRVTAAMARAEVANRVGRVANTAISVVTVTLPLLARGRLHAGSGAYGAMQAAFQIGMLLCAGVLAVRRR